MQKFVPYEKMSKKKQAEYNKQKRNVWGRSPITRSSKNPKAYNRNKVKRESF